ncbi:MAG: cobalamin biosynthesis protein CbiX [Candidatus Scalindua sp. AMX11]|nr:MAG: cobalamin biosynthesis protein CbiX [Candidatus Scalindua sp.]NOG84924.1 CbiX/SirB N-terminal domain-containing protein [Planctomycetota bacterium]RZV84987.1 MAG: cobalamin biosynthesis protein CbiX [Candidatus Scalindua sp. SCAELEC01]TDE63923.1 MAG: cobalamin biosynthesis protein CbiX [Candidatus Scalindua sp. AMX11]GJQ60705.1 MAG: cobalamin biosynthesis protein CbiX [Candidatus Scalindua sp.]
MKALLLVAHGSRRQQSNDEVVLLADKLRKKCFARYSIVHAAFLELAEVLIPDGIKKCIDEGASSVIVLPYFLNSGRHVVEDIPNIVNDTMKYYPDVDIRIAPHLGASDLMMELLIASANSTNPN